MLRVPGLTPWAKGLSSRVRDWVTHVSATQQDQGVLPQQQMVRKLIPSIGVASMHSSFQRQDVICAKFSP